MLISSIPTYSVILEVKCDSTKLGEHVYVAGNSAAFGKWDPKKAVVMRTSNSKFFLPFSAPRLTSYASADFPIWRLSTALPAGSTFEYKYLIKGNAGYKAATGSVFKWRCYS